MNISKEDLHVFDGLSIVTLDGYDGEPQYDGDPDPIGSANYFCESYGMVGGQYSTEECPGILWTDYSYEESWKFSVLIDSREVEALVDYAREAKYSVESIDPITEPTGYGDGSGTVEICKHRDGWVVLD